MTGFVQKHNIVITLKCNITNITLQEPQYEKQDTLFLMNNVRSHHNINNNNNGRFIINKEEERNTT